LVNFADLFFNVNFYMDELISSFLKSVCMCGYLPRDSSGSNGSYVKSFLGSFQELLLAAMAATSMAFVAAIVASFGSFLAWQLPRAYSGSNSSYLNGFCAIVTSCNCFLQQWWLLFR
jgi:hypothetical protein